MTLDTTTWTPLQQAIVAMLAALPDEQCQALWGDVLRAFSAWHVKQPSPFRLLSAGAYRADDPGRLSGQGMQCVWRAVRARN